MCPCSVQLHVQEREGEGVEQVPGCLADTEKEAYQVQSSHAFAAHPRHDPRCVLEKATQVLEKATGVRGKAY